MEGFETVCFSRNVTPAELRQGETGLVFLAEASDDQSGNPMSYSLRDCGNAVWWVWPRVCVNVAQILAAGNLHRKWCNATSGAPRVRPSISGASIKLRGAADDFDSPGVRYVIRSLQQWRALLVNKQQTWFITIISFPLPASSLISSSPPSAESIVFPSFYFNNGRNSINSKCISERVIETT